MSYFELELNLDSTDTNIICFPEKWLNLFLNYEIQDALYRLCLKFYLENHDEYLNIVFILFL